MRSRQLECFVCICETGSITRAAAKLNIAQPALGVQLRTLEQEFGAKLLMRSPAGTVPTAAGRLFLDEARNILRKIDDLKRRLREVEGKKPQSVRIGMPASLTGHLASRLLGTAKIEIPSLRISIVEGPSNLLVQQLRTGSLDMAAAFEARTDGELVARPVLRETLYLVAATGSKLAQKKGPVRLRQLRDVDLTMPGEGDVVRHIVTDMMRAHGMQARIAYPVSSMPAMIDVVAKSLACAVLPASAVAREVEEGKLITRRIIDPSLTRTLSIVQSAGLVATAELVQLGELMLSTLRRIGVENSRFEIHDGIRAGGKVKVRKAGRG
jgi:LysR family nitrogen assimilation transcriptional regulator